MQGREGDIDGRGELAGRCGCPDLRLEVCCDQGQGVEVLLVSVHVGDLLGP
jgi:hypothetical protein